MPLFRLQQKGLEESIFYVLYYEAEIQKIYFLKMK